MINFNDNQFYFSNELLLVTFLKAICRYTIVKNDSDDSEDETVQNDLLKEHVKVVDAFDEILNELENVRIALPKSQYTLRKESRY